MTSAYEQLAPARAAWEAAGARMFLGTPDLWFERGKMRCENDHVSTMALLSEGLGYRACLDCYKPLAMTYPDDVDGPLDLAAASVVTDPTTPPA
jgi:hypothetical protein